MSRTLGARNNNYKKKQDFMIKSSLEYSLSIFPEMTSMRALAAHSKVSLTNFRHYFPSENDFRIVALKKLKKRQSKRAQVYQQFSSFTPRNGLSAILRQFITHWNSGLGKELALARRLSAFSGMPSVHHDEVLQPLLDSVSECLTVYMKRRQLRKGDPSHAALMFLAPAIIKLLPQVEHNSEDSWVEGHVAAYLKCWW